MLRFLAPLSFLALLAAATDAPAQRCSYLPDNTPGSGSGNVIPFGHVSTSNASWSNQKYQAIFPTTTLGNTPGRIVALAFMPRSSGHRQFDSITIKMNHTKLTSMTANFANNLGTGAVTVLNSQNYGWFESAGVWCRVGLQAPFVYIPPMGNLIIEIEVRGAGMPDSVLTHPGFRSVSLQRLYAYNWTTTPPATGTLSGSSGLAMEVCFDTNDASGYGQGCAGSNNQVPVLSYGGSAKLGSKLSIDLSNAAASQPAFLFLGFNNLTPFPLDLAAAGAPGCFFYHTPDLAFGLATNASGALSVPLPIPSSTTFTGFKFFTQYAVFDVKANAFNMVFSNYGRALLGN